MRFYQKLLCLSMSMGVLTGCYSDSIPDTQSTSTPSPIDAPQASPTLLDVTLVKATLKENEHLINYIRQACKEANIPEHIAYLPILLTNVDNQYEKEDLKGIWALSPTTAQNLALKQDYWFDGRLDIQQSTDAVMAYIQYLYHKLGDWDLAITAYITGLQPVNDAVNLNKQHQQPTDLYHLDIDPKHKLATRQLNMIHQLATQQLNPDNILQSVSFPGQIDLENLLAVSGIPEQTLHSLNAGFKRSLTPPDGPHRILAKNIDYKTLLNVTQDPTKLRHVAKSNYSYHTVQKNESLSIIAERFDTSVAEIKRVNHLKTDMIYLHQKLIIPESQPKKPIPPATTNHHPGPKRILHIVQKNESLYQIAKHYQVSIQDISTWNALKKPTIQPHQVITIWQYKAEDTPQFYTVKRNDSLAKIARDHQISIQALKEANQLSGNIIHPGDRLAIPAKKKDNKDQP